MSMTEIDRHSAASTSADAETAAKSAHTARRLLVTGGVQGLGVRPAIHRLATELELAGRVANTAQGVLIEIEGPPARLEVFEQSLPRSLPGPTQLLQIDSRAAAVAGYRGFTIVQESADGPISTRVPLERNVCEPCLHDVARRSDRRHGYAFTSCTQCGPRYTIISAMPFERDQTTMKEFPLCDDCLREFQLPSDRRFHAQTTACPRCGPDLWCQDGGSRLHGISALRFAIGALERGNIIGIRGIGGYQLLVDATNDDAVRRLRERKGRRAKPLAVMVKSTDAAELLAYVSPQERAALADPSGPIVLCAARPKNGLALSIHPQLNVLGLMLPTSPLHALLAHSVRRALVCTSANREGEPLEFEIEAADENLAGICDVWLHHNRAIKRPIDDSVVRVIANRRVTLRLARGFAPLPLDLPAMSPTLAVGGFLKSAAAWSNGSQAVLGPHVGDHESLPSRERYLQHLRDMQQLYQFRPAYIVHDLHPEYFSSRWAEQQEAERLAVQHHHAHIAAGMLEHHWLDRKVIGVAWDGTGYGNDGTIWGGEFLVSTARSFERVARLRPFRLPGAEAAIREPWRTAVSACSQLDETVDWRSLPRWQITRDQTESLSHIVDRPQFSPTTSSAGRLIDAAAALILGVDHADFDGQAAMRLESSADRDAKGWYPFPLLEGAVAELDWRPLLVGLLADCRRGLDPGAVAMRFHRTLAHGITRVCRHWPELPVVLAGGVFQNQLLAELVAEMLGSASQPLGLPGIIPPNDGGLAAGQLVVAAAHQGVIACA